MRFSGQKLRATRRRKDYSRERLAFLSGRSYEAIGMYERGEAQPSVPAALAIAAALGVDINDLIEPTPDLVAASRPGGAA